MEINKRGINGEWKGYLILKFSVRRKVDAKRVLHSTQRTGKKQDDENICGYYEKNPHFKISLEDHWQSKNKQRTSQCAYVEIKLRLQNSNK